MSSLRERGSAIRRARDKGGHQPPESDGGSRDRDKDKDPDGSRDGEKELNGSGHTRRGLRKGRSSEPSQQASHMDDKPDSGEDIESGIRPGRGRGLLSADRDAEEKPHSLRSRSDKSQSRAEEDNGDHQEGLTVEPAAPKEKNILEKGLERGPLRVLEPIRTDPIGPLKSRLKSFERLAAQFLPEVHFIGSILHGEDMLQDPTDGCCCRWKVDYSPSTVPLGGELLGQTQVGHCKHQTLTEPVPFNHPLDLHFSCSGIEGWGSLRIALQTYRVDIHGRRLLCGYGFTHLPTSPGLHRLEVHLWRPSGTSGEEMDAFFLGRVPALVTHEPIYESALSDRARLVTVPAGKVYIELYTITRHMYKHNVDS